MKKIFLSLFFVLAILFLGSKQTMANEGVVNLRSGLNNGSCYAASIYMDGSYRILMTCRELKIALTPERTKYVAWVVGEDDKEKRLGEIVNGKMSVITDVKFKSIYITSEDDSYGNKPTGDVLLTGNVEPIDFGKGVALVTPTPTPTQVEVSTTAKLTPTAKVTSATTKTTQTSSLGSALSTIFKIALMGFGLLLVIVGIFSFLQRRRSL